MEPGGNPQVNQNRRSKGPREGSKGAGRSLRKGVAARKCSKGRGPARGRRTSLFSRRVGTCLQGRAWHGAGPGRKAIVTIPKEAAGMYVGARVEDDVKVEGMKDTLLLPRGQY